MNAMGRECAPDQWPVGLDEAQRPVDGNISDEVSHDIDLFEHSIDQLRAITSADKELLDAWAQDAPLDLQFRPSLVPFGVDDPDSTGSDGNVVDVGLRAGNASVVKDGQGIQPSAEAFLANRASIPGLGALAFALPLLRFITPARILPTPRARAGLRSARLDVPASREGPGPSGPRTSRRGHAPGGARVRGR